MNQDQRVPFEEIEVLVLRDLAVQQIIEESRYVRDKYGFRDPHRVELLKAVWKLWQDGIQDPADIASELKTNVEGALILTRFLGSVLCDRY